MSPHDNDLDLQEILPCRWQNSEKRRGRRSGSIRIYASHSLLEKARHEHCLSQVMNVSLLPGLVGPSMAMPDIHPGTGFCIGGVAAFSEENGIVSPGGVGYDINCGVSLVATSLNRNELSRSDLKVLGSALLQHIPSGQQVDLPLRRNELRDILQFGAPYVAKHYTHDANSLERIEKRGALPVEDITRVSDQALSRGQDQLGTLGSGNHFLEIQYLKEIIDPSLAHILGLREMAICLLLHSGSRGLGHQIASDYIALFQRKKARYSSPVTDPQLVNAPLSSSLAVKYLDAHNAAANFAWSNRHFLRHKSLSVIQDTLRITKEDLSARLITDHSHNMASWEHHPQSPTRLLVHRKGASRALPPGHPEIAAAFRSCGQAIMLPGSMGSSSYLLCGARGSEHAWHSCPHGAGRALSRKAAADFNLREEALAMLESQNILLFSHDRRSLAEEIPQAYKSIEEVMKVTVACGLARPVARFEPLLVIKG